MSKKGNVLVIGNSGVGKSTLINAVLGEEVAKTSYGTAGTTKELAIYENEDISFRLIDTVGFEPSFMKERQAIGAVKKWSKERAEEGKDDTAVNVIWFCVDGAARKLFLKAIEDLSKATSMWKDVPVIAVITKSYATREREENIEMVKDAFRENKRYADNLPDVVPVVAQTFEIYEGAFAPPEGISELIDLTNSKLPEGFKAGKEALARFKLNRKRALAHGLVSVATAGGATVGFVPIDGVADAAILTPTEMAMIRGLAKIYEIENDDAFEEFMETAIGAGLAGAAAKGILGIMKLVPGVNVAAAVADAAVAGSIVATLGEVTIYMFEQVYLHNKPLVAAELIEKIKDKLGNSDFVEKLEAIGEDLMKAPKLDIATIISVLAKHLI